MENTTNEETLDRLDALVSAVDKLTKKVEDLDFTPTYSRVEFIKRFSPTILAGLIVQGHTNTGCSEDQIKEAVAAADKLYTECNNRH